MSQTSTNGVRARVVLAVVVATMAATGCASFTTYKNPKPLSKGATQVYVALQSDVAGPKETGVAPFPEMGLSVRHGVTERVEVGGTLVGLYMGEPMALFGYEGLTKLHLYSYPYALDVGVGAGAGYRIYRTSGTVLEMVHASLPLITGIHVGAKHQLIFSPMISFQRWYSDGTNPVNILALGTSVGFRLQISERFSLFPEFSVFHSLDGSLDNFDQRGLIHAGIALVFGKP